MAKPPGKSGGTSRIKFIMLDAEIADDQIQSVTQAIANALRPATPPAPKRLPAAAPQLNGNGADHEDNDQSDLFEALEEEEAVDVTPAPARPKVPRKAPKAPDIVPIEMNEPVSFADFAAGKKNDSLHKKYLIASAWLYEHRSTPIITDGHIYTCFRSIGWSTAHNDFGQPLRELKTRKFFTTPSRGNYEINHIGLDYVKKLANGAE
jgi:hypothetical protein